MRTVHRYGDRALLVDCSDTDEVLGEWAATTSAEPSSTGDRAVVDIPVRYDGPDLAEVAVITGMSCDDVVATHTGATYRAAFSGFRPGFAYLVGLDPRLTVPRRSTPRTSVPAGSVAIAESYTGV